MFFLKNTDLPKDPDDPHVDPYYVGSNKEMEDDAHDIDIEGIEADTDIDNDDD